LNDEIDSCLSMLIERKVEHGSGRQEARRLAMLELGGAEQVKEKVRGIKMGSYLETLLQDLRYGVRMLVRHPAFTTVAVLTIALGIGANTAIFSLVNDVLLRPLPYNNANRIVLIEEDHDQTKGNNVSYAAFLDLVGHARSFDSIGAYRNWNFNLITNSGEPEQIEGAMVSSDLFSVFGVTPGVGRFFLQKEDQPGGDNVAVLSYGLWQRRFGSDHSIIGKTIKLSDRTCTVIGVTPVGFQFPVKADIWTPLVAGGGLSQNRRSHLLTVIARLNAATTIEKARSELAILSHQIEQQNPGVDAGMTLNVIGLQQRMVAPVKSALLILFGAVGLVLLIACTNVANLLLARGSSRARELAIRTSLGAGRSRIVRQLLTESVLLSLLGGALGLLLAVLALKSIVAASLANLPRLNEVGGNGIDLRVLGFTLLVSIFTGIVFGLIPAIGATRADLHDSLKQGSRGSSGSNSRRFSNILVVSEVALALILLIGAGLLIKSFARLLQVNPGFNPDRVLAINLFLSPSKYSGDAQRTAFIKQTLERVSTVPGVQSVSMSLSLPTTGGPSTDFEIVGSPATDYEPLADVQIISPDYFRTMSIPLQKGRAFNERDTGQSQKVMVINETMARQYWPNEDPIGKRVTIKDWGPPLTGEIVGVAGDVKMNGLDSDLRPMIYWPYTQFPQIFNNLVIRTTAESSDVIAAVKSQIWSVDGEQPMGAIRTMDQVLSDSVTQRCFNMLLLAIFATVALALAAVGIYGVISHSVGERIHEIGIRVALGAQRRDVYKLIICQGMIPALCGIALGIIASLVLTQQLSALLFSVKATDPTTFIVLSVLLTMVALLACYLPSRRATRVDPMVALRYE
jgi:putative ABC transport system permease protein